MTKHIQNDMSSCSGKHCICTNGVGSIVCRETSCLLIRYLCKQMAGAKNVTWTRKPSFLERIGKSISGILFGLIMFCLSFVVIYLNEGASVNVQQMLDEVQKQIVPLDDTNLLMFNNKLTHYVGFLATEQKITDNVYGVSFSCVKLKREVEVYQWVEHSDLKEIDEGDEIRHERTYYYETEWSSTLHKSQGFAEEFGHRNPKSFPFEKYDQTASTVMVNGIQLSAMFVDQINWFELVHSPPVPTNKEVKVHGQYYYHGQDPRQPEVGDYRVSFQCAGKTQHVQHGLAEQVSIIGMIQNGMFAQHKTSNSYSVAFLYRGVKSHNEILTLKQSHNSFFTWVVRFGGFAMMFVGLSIMTRIVVVIVDWIPIVRSIVSASVTMFNLTLSIFLSTIAIALCWLRFHPWLASAMIGASLLPWFLSLQRASTL